ncbi:MAG: nucleoside recognition domain-containing protein [Mycoplasmatota bacterium]
MINKVWSFFIISGILFSLLSGNINEINETILFSSKNTLDLIFQIFPVIALWLGIMQIASNSGLLNYLSKKLSPLLKHIFPDIPKNHESLSLISSNIVVNALGLGSAATPFGLKAMQSLQTINNKKNEASRSMITFLVINTAGVTLIPTTVIALRMNYGSINPSQTIFASILVTITSLFFAILIDRILYKIYE